MTPVGLVLTPVVLPRISCAQRAMAKSTAPDSIHGLRGLEAERAQRLEYVGKVRRCRRRRREGRRQVDYCILAGVAEGDSLRRGRSGARRAVRRRRKNARGAVNNNTGSSNGCRACREGAAPYRAVAMVMQLRREMKSDEDPFCSGLCDRTDGEGWDMSSERQDALALGHPFFGRGLCFGPVRSPPAESPPCSFPLDVGRRQESLANHQLTARNISRH